VIIGAVTLAVAGILGYLLATVHKGLPFEQTTHVRAVFKDVDSLLPGDQVRQNSVRIGSVEDVKFVKGRAVATLKLEGDRPVYRNARAKMLDYTAVGTKFVELDPGAPSAGRLSDNAVIPASRNVDSVDLYKVLDVLDKPTRDAAMRGVRELGGGAAGHGQDLHDMVASAPDLLSDLGDVSHSLADKSADLPSLLRSADQLTARFAGREHNITALIGQTDRTFKGVSVDGAQPLQNTLQGLPSTLRSTRSALDSLESPLADTHDALATLRPGAAALGDSASNLRGVLREGVPPLRRLVGVAKQAEPAVGDLTRMLHDARPLAPKVTEAMASAVTPLRIMAPYAPEFGQFFVRGNSFLAGGPALPGIHYARLGVAPGVGSAAGSVLGDDLLGRNIYPKPGEASHDRVGLLGGGR
jgi:phospholipid/cholesterol/gamma-HCH transport system substrate-binding protein